MTSLAKLSCIFINFLLINSHAECQQRNENAAATVDAETVIDPHSIYFQRYEKKVVQSTENFLDEVLVKRKEAETRSITNQENCIQSKIYYKRLVNILLSNAVMKREGNLVEGKLHIEASVEQIEILQNLRHDKLSLQEIDLILSEIIKKPRFSILEEASYVTEQIAWFVRDNKEIIIPIILTALLLLAFKNVVWSRSAIFTFVFLSILLISFVITYWQLLQEAEIKLIATQAKFREMPSSCLPNQMSLLEKLSALFFANDDCESYHKAVMTDPKLQVTPALVISRLFSTVVLHPLEIFGHALSEFVENATGKLSGPIRWLVIFLLFCAVSLLIIVFPFCLTGGAFSISLGPLFRCSLSGGRSSNNSLEDSKRPERIERIQEITYVLPTSSIKTLPCSHESENPTNVEKTENSEGKCGKIGEKICRKIDDGSGDANSRNCEKIVETTKCNCEKIGENG